MLLFSLRQVKKYKILSFRRNLLTMKEHTFISCCLLFYCGSDQMLMKIIESIHESTSVKDVFKLWWTTHLIEKILVFPFKNVLILVSARNFPEFHGYFGQIFPEQEKPKWPLPSFPGWWTNEYLQFYDKRFKFADSSNESQQFLSTLFPRPRRILVSEAHSDDIKDKIKSEA